MTATGLGCRSCGTELPPESRFCNKCGQPITPAATSAEYKQVTVSVRRRGPFDGHRGGGWDGTVARDHDRAGRPLRRRWCSATAARWTSSPATASWRCSVRRSHWKITLFAHAWPRWAFRTRSRGLAAEVERRDGVELRLRVGLNSGQVIAGEIGSGAVGYTAIGEQVGMAQRMESVAPPGGVMLSESTARLVEDATVLGEPERVRIKGADEAVPRTTVVGRIGPRIALSAASSRQLVGRRWEIGRPRSALLERAIGGHGAWSPWSGRPGIGKSRLVREVAAMAAARGVEVFSDLLRIAHQRDPVPRRWRGCCVRPAASSDLDDAGCPRPGAGTGSRRRSRGLCCCFDDLLGIADPEVALPKIDPDARRRRLTALVNAASLARDDAGGLRRRGRALDRRGQRVDAGRVPHGDPADTRRWC